MGAEVYNLLGRGVKSFNDYQNEDADLQAKRINLLGLQQNQADDNALRMATKQFGTDAAANRGLIAGTGNYKVLSAFDKAQMDNAKTQSDITESGAKTNHFNAQTGEIGDKRTQARRLQHISEVAAVNDLPGAQKWLSDAVQSGEIPFEHASAMYTGLTADPSRLPAWKASVQQVGMTPEQQATGARSEREFGLKANNDIMMPDGKGGFTVNQPYLDAKKQVAKSGASNVSVKVDNALGEGVAKQVGPMVEQSYNAASGAQASIANADNIIKAIDSGKVIAGPGASMRMGLAQVADTLGLGGKDTKEKIENTRATIQGLNQSILTARSQLKGQGQVSDYEGKLLAKATAGDIDDLTAPEIRQLAVLNKKLSNQVIAQHGQLITKLKSHAPTQPIADLFETNPGAPQAQTAPAAPAAGGFKYIGPAQ